MVPKALVIMAEGCEELETAASVDILTRGGFEVVTASLTANNQPIAASRGVTFVAQQPLDAVVDDFFSVIVLPGGEGGASRIAENPKVKERLLHQHKTQQWIAAICAAPALALVPFGLITPETKATCYPSCEGMLPQGSYENKTVVVDHQQKLITSQGPATAIAFALAIVSQIQGERTAKKVAQEMLLDAA